LYLACNGRFALWDRDEPRYAQTSRQMLQGGDWVVPRFLDKPRTAKPVLIYWCQASAMAVFGDNAFAARFPSAIAMTLTLIVLAVVIDRAIGPRRAIWTVFILGTSAIVIVCAKSCFTDAVLLLWIVIAEIGMFAIWRGSRSWANVMVISIAVGLAGLTKGPVVLGVMLFTGIALAAMRWFDRRAGASQKGGHSYLMAQNKYECPPFRGAERVGMSIAHILVAVAIVASICGPWLHLMQQRVPNYLQDTFWKEVIDRSRRPAEGHKGPPGFYLLTIWATYFPWSLLMPAALVQAWKRRNIPMIRFCFAAVVGPWIMFEIVQTKLMHYLLPIFPPLAFLTADMLVRAGRRIHQDITNRGFVRVVAAWGVIVVGAVLAMWTSVIVFPGESPPAEWWWLFVISLIAIEYVRQIYVYFRAARPLAAADVMGIGMMIFMAAMYCGYLRHAEFLRISERLAAALRANHATADIRMIGYKEPSLAFYQGGTIREERDNQFLQNHPPGEWPDWLVITEDLWQGTPREIRDQFELVESARGWNYANAGKVVEVIAVQKRIGGEVPSK